MVLEKVLLLSTCCSFAAGNMCSLWLSLTVFAISFQLPVWKAPGPVVFISDLNILWLIGPNVNRARADSLNAGIGKKQNKADVKKYFACLGITSMLRNQLVKEVYFCLLPTYSGGSLADIFWCAPSPPKKTIPYICQSQIQDKPHNYSTTFTLSDRLLLEDNVLSGSQSNEKISSCYYNS